MQQNRSGVIHAPLSMRGDRTGIQRSRTRQAHAHCLESVSLHVRGVPFSDSLPILRSLERPILRHVFWPFAGSSLWIASRFHACASREDGFVIFLSFGMVVA
ncbi:MAG TPA: hypothetical protein VJU59_39860 [Paraburkholderia sp.]|uniref:hypothetical protein n=1 Tax=Paraburkholderia sp. TaxID=1926495 RepID=UPI002B4A09AE|nr:hypothetical protein [Paraburkholderia sp.]HKR45757.1 hypothetical protein [Paraburkholderia sp.]